MMSPSLAVVVAAVLTFLLAGCASENLAVPIGKVATVPGKPEAERQVKIQVTDIRREIHMERTTIGGLSLGRVSLEPPVPELVRALIAAKAEAVLADGNSTSPVTVLCGIRVFDVTTPATALYWDIHTKIELVLRVHGQDRIVSGTATERTFVWPSDEIIQRVTEAALGQVGSEAERALKALLAVRP